MEKEIDENEPLARIANALEQQQKLHEIEVLCKVAETAKSLAKCSITCFHEQGYSDAEELVMIAIAKSREILQKGN